MQDEADEAKSPAESEDKQLSVSDAALSMEPPAADILTCNTGYNLSSNSSARSVSPSVLSKDCMIAGGRVEETGSADSSAEDNDWFSYKRVFGDDLGRVHDALDVVDIDSCPSESACNTIDFDTIIDLGLNTTDVLTRIRSRDCEQIQSEIISEQSSLTDSASRPSDMESSNKLLHCGRDYQDKALNAGGLGIQLDGPDTVATKAPAEKPVSMLAEAYVPCCMASGVPQLSSRRCETATSFLTPRTPSHSQGLPTYATHFSFSSVDELQSSSPVSVQRPKTPVVSVSLPVHAHPQLSPQAPYTPDTPSVFQFPSPNQSPASSSGCSPAALRHSKRHTANYHPYSSPSASTSSPRYLSHQQTSAQQLDQQKRLEMDLAEAHSEIDQYVHQLHQADLQRQQQTQHEPGPKEMLSKLFVTVPEEPSMLTDANNGNSSAASYGQAFSPLEEVIQILVAEHFGVTVPSKFLQADLKLTDSNSKMLTTQPAAAGSNDQHPVSKEFRNPGTVPASKPRKQKPEPLVIPASVSNFGFRSQLRSPKPSESVCTAQHCQTTTPPPYTPPPMISPARTGSGVFWTLHGARQIPTGPLSAPPYHVSFPRMCCSVLFSASNDKNLCVARCCKKVCQLCKYTVVVKGVQKPS